MTLGWDVCVCVGVSVCECVGGSVCVSVCVKRLNRVVFKCLINNHTDPFPLFSLSLFHIYAPFCASTCSEPPLYTPPPHTHLPPHPHTPYVNLLPPIGLPPPH